MRFAFKFNQKIENILFIVLGIFLTVFLLFIFLKSLKFGIIIFLFLLFVFLFFKSGKLSFNNLIYLLLFCSILCPPIRFESIPSIRPELILIFIAWALLILGRIAKGNNIKLKWTSIHKWFFIFGGCILVSILWAWLIKGFVPIYRDFFEIAKLFEYFLIFTLIVNLNIQKRDLKKYYIFIVFLFLLSTLFGFAQYYNTFDINEKITSYYAPTQMDGLIKHKRIVGTTANPNEFGILMAIASILSLVKILWSREVKTKLLLFIPFLVFVFSVILSLSRSALICLIIGMFFVLFYKYPKKFELRGKIRVLFLILPLFAILTTSFLFITPQKFFERMESALVIRSDISFQTRLEEWDRAISIWKKSPIFGWGPGKDIMTTTIDNEWLLILRRYGIVGFLVFFLWFFNFYQGIGKIQQKNQDNLFIETFSISLQVSLVIIGIYMIPAGFFHSLQGMPFLITLLGIIYSQHNSKV